MRAFWENAAKTRKMNSTRPQASGQNFPPNKLTNEQREVIRKRKRDALAISADTRRDDWLH